LRGRAPSPSPQSAVLPGRAAGGETPGLEAGRPEDTLRAVPQVSPEARLRELGIELPTPRAPVATFVPAVTVGDMLYVAGHTPRMPDGSPGVRGKVGRELTLEEGRDQARIVGLLVLATLFFWTAGTARYWQAWLYLGVLLGPMAVATTWLLGHDPALLERRMRMREPRAGQRTLVALAALALFVVVAIPGRDRRLGWSSVAPAIVLAADLIVLAGYGLFFRVLQVNHHASRVV